MFLALTADRRYWDKSEELLLLGEWCDLYESPSEATPIAPKVAPYPWDDRRRLFHDFQYLRGQYDRLLPLLATRLNQIHGLEAGLPYWRLIVGPWLYYFVYNVYERWICLQDTATAYPGLRTFILPPSTHRIPVSFHHYCRWIVGDQYNLDLYSQLIPSVTGLTFACEDLPERRVAPVETPDARHTFNRLKHRVFWRMGRRNRLVLAESYFPFMRNVRFYLRERQIPLPAFPDDPELMVAADPSGRKKLTLSAGTDPFEKILAKLVPDNIPTNYIEGFGQLRDRTKDLPNLTKAIVASSRLITHDLFKTWAAEQQQRGAAVVDVQHGGQYGSGLWNSDEDHERRVATRFCSWGWSDDDQRIRPTISFKLSQQPLVRPNPKGKILAALMSLPRYCYFMCSIPMAGQLKGYWQDQIAMAQALSERVRRMLQWRLYMIDYGWRESQRLKDAIPGADVSQGSGPLWRQLKSCRLFIGTYNSTAYLETLAGNFPTVLFWNPAHWELRESARFFYDALASNGILHATPREAAAHIEKIADDPSAWWSQPGVQRARERFCAQFARRSPHWQPEWHREFHEAAHG